MAPICEPPSVVLTGFGPFGDHKTNDSWTAVCQVAQGERGKQLERRLGVKLIVKEMPVCYEFADRTVPQLWAEHNPLVCAQPFLAAALTGRSRWLLSRLAAKRLFHNMRETTIDVSHNLAIVRGKRFEPFIPGQNKMMLPRVPSRQASAIGIVCATSTKNGHGDWEETAQLGVRLKERDLFVLHAGIHKDDLFRIETKSRKTDYHCKDVEGRTPDGCSCKAGSNDVMETTLDVTKLLNDVRKALAVKETDVKLALSEDPGNFLCGYTYYTSLCCDAGRTLFLHIPPSSSSVPISHKADVVEAVVIHSVDQVRQKTCPKTTAV